MKTTELRWKTIVEYLALQWGNCEKQLQVWERGRTLPMIPTVYCLVNALDSIQYIGQTSCLRRRIAQHVSDPRKEKLKWDRVLCFSPRILAQHRRLQIEATLTALAVPPGNSLIALRRTRYNNWTEVRWRVSRWNDVKNAAPNTNS